MIELLIVVAIIGILASVVLVKLVTVRERTRDAARLASIKSIRSALEVFYAEHNHYPASSGCGATVPNVNWCNSVESDLGVTGHWLRDSGIAASSWAKRSN